MITGNQLRDAFISGANNIAKSRQKVDALNVFPVPDGDTGTNMSMTIGAAKKEMEHIKDGTPVGEVASRAASALLRGARGNSGVILSLLFRGFSKGLKDKETANAVDFARAMEMGVSAAYKAVMKPTEGTILTVARLGAEHAKKVVNDEMSMEDIFIEYLEAAQDALDKTPDLLPVLKKAGVVDAGGKGLVVILEGMLEVIKGKPIVGAVEELGVLEKGTIDVAGEVDDEEINFTYCTEFIINKFDKKAEPLSLRAYLESIGDCVVVVDDEDIIKCHVHTDNPGNAIQSALKIGYLTNMKIDNMREQYEANKASETEKSNSEFPYAAVDQDKEFGFVAIGAGEGVKQLFLDLGVDNVVSGGQTMNPSTDDILSAIHATPAKNVFVLPNNKNIIMAAEQAVKLADRKVYVLQTTTIPQGLSAMLAFDSSEDVKANTVTMTKAFEKVGTGTVTFAARDSEFDGKKIKQGDLLAIENGKISFIDSNLSHAVTKLTASLVKKSPSKDESFVTLIYGEGVSEDEAAMVEIAVHDRLGENIEIAMIRGDQPVYYFIISVE